jgi:apolipoprotein N-acyltransferase
VVEGDGDGFHNAQVAIDPDGNFIDRYEKVHRVPFGEYVPLRWLLEPIAGDSLITRDAFDGSDPAILHTTKGTMGVSISWEIFFADRAREAVRQGGEVLLNPTNGASFHGSIIHSQQIASSRLRAIENGRWVVQAAPTGFSAVITPDGDIVERSGISERRVLEQTVQRRTGLTWATRVGDWLALCLSLFVIALGWFVQLRSREGSSPDRRSPAPLASTSGTAP